MNPGDNAPPYRSSVSQGMLIPKITRVDTFGFLRFLTVKTVKKLSTCYSILYQGDVGKMCCVWDSKTSHAVSVTPFL